MPQRRKQNRVSRVGQAMLFSIKEVLSVKGTDRFIKPKSEKMWLVDT